MEYCLDTLLHGTELEKLAALTEHCTTPQDMLQLLTLVREDMRARAAELCQKFDLNVDALASQAGGSQSAFECVHCNTYQDVDDPEGKIDAQDIPSAVSEIACML
jgi:hypothetical protein